MKRLITLIVLSTVAMLMIVGGIAGAASSNAPTWAKAMERQSVPAHRALYDERGIYMHPAAVSLTSLQKANAVWNAAAKKPGPPGLEFNIPDDGYNCPPACPPPTTPCTRSMHGRTVWCSNGYWTCISPGATGFWIWTRTR